MLIILGFLAVYSYLIYPLILLVMPARRVGARAYGGVDELPSMTVLITAHNEEARIRSKLENALALDYPREQLEVVVASDQSTDRTDEFVSSFADRGVRLVRADQRLGKEYAQKCAIDASTNELLVFSDVATELPADSLRRLAEEFGDESVGAVSSTDRFVSRDGKLVGEGAYVRYEMWLRRLESRRAGLVGLSGSFFAARREVCNPWDTQSPSDFNTAMNCARHGKVAISSDAVVGIYRDVANASAEYRRKWRTAVRGINALARHPEVLNPFRYGRFAFQVISHKLMRWLVPWFLLAFAIVSVASVPKGPIFLLLCLLQLVFYGVAAIGHFVAESRELMPVRIVYYFVVANIALAHAAVSYLFGVRMTVWTPTSR